MRLEKAALVGGAIKKLSLPAVDAASGVTPNTLAVGVSTDGKFALKIRNEEWAPIPYAPLPEIADIQLGANFISSFELRPATVYPVADPSANLIHEYTVT